MLHRYFQRLAPACNVFADRGIIFQGDNVKLDALVQQCVKRLVYTDLVGLLPELPEGGLPLPIWFTIFLDDTSVNCGLVCIDARNLETNIVHEWV